MKTVSAVRIMEEATIDTKRAKSVIPRVFIDRGGDLKRENDIMRLSE